MTILRVRLETAGEATILYELTLGEMNTNIPEIGNASCATASVCSKEEFPLIFGPPHQHQIHSGVLQVSGKYRKFLTVLTFSTFSTFSIERFVSETRVVMLPMSLLCHRNIISVRPLWRYLFLSGKNVVSMPTQFSNQIHSHLSESSPESLPSCHVERLRPR